MTTTPAPPHGGALIDRHLPPDMAPLFLERARTLPRLRLDRNQVLDLEKIADGTFSPLTGFMGSAETQAVMDRIRLPSGLPWSIPILLTVTPPEAASVEPGSTAVLENGSGRIAGLIEVAEIFPWEKTELATKVYGTTDRRHPGVDQLFRRGDLAVAGDVRLLERSESPIPPRFDLSPAEVRRRIAEKGWRRIVGFQTRNLGHRAHEHLQKTALEFADGLLIHPLIGWKKPGDMLPDVILEGYEVLIERYYRPGRVLLAGLTTAMRYAGPREAVFHAIIRKNFGCTHFIVGRDHAGVGGFYGKYDAHRIFDDLIPDLGITPFRLHGPFYCRACAQCTTEHVCPHGEEERIEISGTDVRAMLARGERPPAEFMRPEISDFLISRARRGPIFFEGDPVTPSLPARF